MTPDTKALSEQWVLVGKTVGGPNNGAPRYHLEDYPIGPASTPVLDKAKVFGSREEACQSAGFRHWSSNMLPVTLEDARALLSSLSPELAGTNDHG